MVKSLSNIKDGDVIVVTDESGNESVYRLCIYYKQDNKINKTLQKCYKLFDLDFGDFVVLNLVDHIEDDRTLYSEENIREHFINVNKGNDITILSPRTFMNRVLNGLL